MAVLLTDDEPTLRQQCLGLLDAPSLHLGTIEGRGVRSLLDEGGAEVRLHRPARRAPRPERVAELDPPEGLGAGLVAVLFDPPSVEQGERDLHADREPGEDGP